jgi:hypothetical protein
MHRRGDAGDLVDQQDRGAVSNQNGQGEVGRSRDDAVRRRRFPDPGPVHDHDVRALTLVHEEQLVSPHTEGAGHSRPVGLDRLRIVPHVPAQVEAGEVPRA